MSSSPDKPKIIMIRLKKAWYALTASVPRQLPRTELEYAKLKDILHQYFDLRDEPAIWATVAGVICGTPPFTTKRKLSHIVANAKRLDINKLANEEKNKAILDLQQRLERAAKDFAEHEAKESKEAALEAIPAQIEAPKEAVQ